MSCTALVLYERWAVEDPVLDCAIRIIDTNNYRYITEPNPDGVDTSELQYPEAFAWPPDPWSTYMSLSRSEDFVKSLGRVGYIWVDEALKEAADILHHLGMMVYHEYMIERILEKLDRRAQRI